MCFGCKEDCLEKVSLLPEGFHRAYQDRDDITFEITELDSPWKVDILHLSKAFDADIFLEESGTYDGCAAYRQVHHAYFLDDNGYSRVDHYLALPNNDQQHTQLGILFRHNEHRLALHHQDFKLDAQMPSGIYELKTGGFMRFTLDSGLVWAKNQDILIKRIL